LLVGEGEEHHYQWPGLGLSSEQARWQADCYISAVAKDMDLPLQVRRAVAGKTADGAAMSFLLA